MAAFDRGEETAVSDYKHRLVLGSLALLFASFVACEAKDVEAQLWYYFSSERAHAGLTNTAPSAALNSSALNLVSNLCLLGAGQPIKSTSTSSAEWACGALGADSPPVTANRLYPQMRRRLEPQWTAAGEAAYLCDSNQAGAGKLCIAFYYDAQPTCGSARTMNIVAHQDDDLLFMSPDLLHELSAGRCVRTVYITAGDAGVIDNPPTYWPTREDGAKAAHAAMLGVPNEWIEDDAGIPGHPAKRFTLNANRNTSLVFLRLPDGCQQQGGCNHDNRRIEALWDRSAQSIATVDNSSTYSRDDLTNALRTLMVDYQPDEIHTQDFTAGPETVPLNTDEHPDHFTGAYFARDAAAGYATPHTLTGYVGYPAGDDPAGGVGKPGNVEGLDLVAKVSAFFTYAAFDGGVPCKDLAACDATEPAYWGYHQWVRRQYTVGLPATQSPGH
jgi:LmbE family N-acetylglucosaminyl deacetylase